MNYEEKFEIDGMKFTISYVENSADAAHIDAAFILTDEQGNTVANRKVRVDKVLDFETWKREVAEPASRMLKVFVAKNYLVTETMGLNAADLHKTADSDAELKDVTFRKDWFRYLTNKIKDAAEHGLYEVVIARNLQTDLDKDMPKGYNETVMKDETIKVLTAKGFSVKLTNLKNGVDPNAFAIIIHW